MNTANYRSFNTAYSTLKIQKGCKGIGRFLWLKAFETVEIESVFQEDGQYYRRKFSFNPDGVSPENNLVKIDEDDIKTIVRLNNFATQYRHAAPVRASSSLQNGSSSIVYRSLFRDTVRKL